jgi:hypothetical protein
MRPPTVWITLRQCWVVSSMTVRTARCGHPTSNLERGGAAISHQFRSCPSIVGCSVSPGQVSESHRCCADTRHCRPPPEGTFADANNRCVRPRRRLRPPARAGSPAGQGGDAHRKRAGFAPHGKLGHFYDGKRLPVRYFSSTNCPRLRRSSTSSTMKAGPRSMIITKHRRPVAVLKPAHLRPRRLSQLSNSPYRIPSMIRFSTRKWLRGKVIRPLRTFACHPATLGRNVTVMQCNGPADHST